MNTSSPFSLRIFVADGDPDGLRLVERSNWIGKAVVFPRAILPKIKKRDEFNQTGVYLLLGPREDGEGDKVYIGEGDPVCQAPGLFSSACAKFIFQFSDQRVSC